MKLINKPLPILLVLLAVLVALVSYKNSSKEQMYRELPALDAELIAQVEKILLKKEKDALILTKKAELAWQVNEGPWMAKNSRMERMLLDLANLKKADVFSKREDRLEQYGLDSTEQGLVGLVRGTDSTWLAIGKTDANFSGVFFRMKGESEVYRSPGAMWIDAEARSWIDGKIFDVNPATVNKLSYVWADDSSATWVKDDSTQTSPEKWTEINGKVLHLEADEFWSEIPEHDSLAQSLTVHLESGDSLVLDILGENNGKYVAKHSNGQVIGLNTWRLAGIKPAEE